MCETQDGRVLRNVYCFESWYFAKGKVFKNLSGSHAEANQNAPFGCFINILLPSVANQSAFGSKVL